MNPQPEIDLSTFNQLKRDMGADFIGEVVETFIEDTQQQISTLRQALENQDGESFRRAAHSIKSTSSTLGALRYANLARELEMLGKDNRLDEASVKVDLLVEAYPPVEKALKDLCRDQYN